MIHPHIVPAWDLASINSIEWWSAFVLRHHLFHQGVQSQFLEWRPLWSLFGEQGLCKHCHKGTPLVISWFHPPTRSSSGYEQQDHINPYHMEMASMAMIHFGLDPGKFVRFLLGEYTGQHWDVCRTLDAVWDHVTSDDYRYSAHKGGPIYYAVDLILRLLFLYHFLHTMSLWHHDSIHNNTNNQQTPPLWWWSRLPLQWHGFDESTPSEWWAALLMFVLRQLLKGLHRFIKLK